MYCRRSANRPPTARPCDCKGDWCATRYARERRHAESLDEISRQRYEAALRKAYGGRP